MQRTTLSLKYYVFYGHRAPAQWILLLIKQCFAQLRDSLFLHLPGEFVLYFVTDVACYSPVLDSRDITVSGGMQDLITRAAISVCLVSRVLLIYSKQPLKHGLLLSNLHRVHHVSLSYLSLT